MAITWRNIGQSGNSGNSLIKSGSDTITQGLNTLRGVAQEVSDEGTRQYNTQADINTAGVLSDISRYSQEDIDNFDVGALSKQFGNQYDAAGIADALDARVGALQEVAQQEADNTDRSLRTQNALATGELNRTNLQGQIDARAEAKAKADKFSAFSKSVNSRVGEFSSVEDIRKRITQQGQKENMSGAEINQAINTATNTFNNVIDVQAPQKALLDERAQQQAQLTQRTAQNQLASLDRQARTRGIIPELAELSITPESSETSIKALSDQYDRLVSDAGYGEEDSVTAFQSKLAKRFNDKGLPAPNGAELKHFLSLGFDEGYFGTDDGLDIDLIESQINKYIEMRKDKKAIDTYNKSKAAIQVGAQETAKQQAKDIATYADTIRANNRARFKGDTIVFEEPIPAQLQDRRTRALKTTDWFQGN